MKQTPKQSTPNKRTLKKGRFQHHIYIESYGVKIRVSSNEIAAINAITELLPGTMADCYRLVEEGDVDHNFYYVWNVSGRDSLYKDGEPFAVRIEREHALDAIGSQIRITVGEFAVGKVFVHAGVVSWKGKAIVIPAASFRGKTTLTAELIRRGALYYSDEYAVFDKDGLVSPFPKMLSIRGEIDDYQQIDYPVEAFGGKAGTEHIPVGMVLITKYKPNAKWKPVVLSSGKGLMEIIRNTVPIRNDPNFTLAALKHVAKNAVIVKSSRGEASEFADHILQFFEPRCL